MAFRSYADMHTAIRSRLDEAGISRAIWGVEKNKMSYLVGRGIRVSARVVKLDLKWPDAYLENMVSGIISTIRHGQKEPIE